MIVMKIYEPECSASKPRVKGCCNKFGFCGLGPDFKLHSCTNQRKNKGDNLTLHIVCGGDCVANCERKSECDPGDYGDYAESKKCPLDIWNPAL